MRLTTVHHWGSNPPGVEGSAPHRLQTPHGWASNPPRGSVTFQVTGHPQGVEVHIQVTPAPGGCEPHSSTVVSRTALPSCATGGYRGARFLVRSVAGVGRSAVGGAQTQGVFASRGDTFISNTSVVQGGGPGRDSPSFILPVVEPENTSSEARPGVPTMPNTNPQHTERTTAPPATPRGFNPNHKRLNEEPTHPPPPQRVSHVHKPTQKERGPAHQANPPPRKTVAATYSPTPPQGSTISAKRLNDRVRNETGCDPPAKTTTET